MNPDIKAKWVAALRSGEYKKGNNYLHQNNTFCCLGVLCDLHAKATGDQWDARGAYRGHTQFLPGVVREWSGVPEGAEDGSVDANALMKANDAGESFAEIADIIEREL